jgi:hypothetical protein
MATPGTANDASGKVMANGTMSKGNKKTKATGRTSGSMSGPDNTNASGAATGSSTPNPGAPL